MPVKDGSASRARLVDGGCNNFANQMSGKVWRATKEQKISTQVWRIPHERININVLKERVEEDIGVYAKEECSILVGMGKYIPVQTNREIIFYSLRKKLGCIFIENHNSESLELKKGQMIGLVTSCLVTQAEQVQIPKER